VNAGTIGAEVHTPFGGTKATGNGHREGGAQVLDVFSEWKTVYIDPAGSSGLRSTCYPSAADASGLRPRAGARSSAR